MLKRNLEEYFLKSKEVFIDGIKIDNQQIIDIEIYQDINSISTSGSIEFKDITSLVERLPITGENKIQFLFKDLFGTIFDRTFIITDLTQDVPISGIRTVNIIFIDSLSYYSSNMYPISSYKEASIIDIIDKEIKDIKEDLEKDYTEDLPGEKYNIVIPNDRPFSWTLNYLLETSNLLFYNTKDKYVLKSFKELFKQEPKEDIFIFNSENPKYAFKIFEAFMNQANVMQSSLALPDSETYSYDILNKSKKTIKYSKEDMYKELEPKGTLELNMSSLGSKIFWKPNEFVNDRIKTQFYNQGFNLISGSIIVPGNLNTNVGEVITIKVTSNNPDSKSGSEENLSGDWLITEIVDKYSRDDFSQKITISKLKLK